MRRALLALSALALLPAAAVAASLGVPLDQSVRLTLSAPAHDVIVGNPSIADVSIADDHHLIVTGKTAGMTNLIVTDLRGHTIFDREVVVHAGGGVGDSVTLIAGATATTYACAPTCVTSAGTTAYGPPLSATPAPAASGAAPVAAPAPGNTSAIQASPGIP